MSAAVESYEAPLPRGRGSQLLLEHCAGIYGSEEREAPYVRLEDVVGRDLAHLLVFGLAGVYGRRGASSP